MAEKSLLPPGYTIKCVPSEKSVKYELYCGDKWLFGYTQFNVNMDVEYVKAYPNLAADRGVYFLRDKAVEHYEFASRV